MEAHPSTGLVGFAVMAASPSNTPEQASVAQPQCPAEPASVPAPLETMRRRLSERPALEATGPLFEGAAAPPHRQHHSPYR